MFKKREYGSLEELLKQNRVFYHFAKLCEIPHPSFKEARISDYLLGWAREQGLSASQDEYHNVFIKKPATPGYEDAPAVMLQAHMDMVCEKAPGVEHNFDTDPIHLQLDEDLLSTGGRTTLGADDGIGVAYAMAILEADGIPHPLLEVLFTTAEEEDLSGAQNVDATSFKARMLINIDNAVEHELLAGSCGGSGVELELPAVIEPVCGQYTAYRVTISGLPGGHSGEDIARGYGNANILLARLLYAYKEEFPIRISELQGGSFRLAIPRDAMVCLYIPDGKEEQFKEITGRMEQDFRREYESVAPKLTITALSEKEPAGCASSEEASEKLLQALYLSPDGISAMNNAVAGVVESSDNLGELRLEAGKGRFVIVYEIRAAFESTREFLLQKIHLLANVLGGSCRDFSEYPSWAFNPGSQLRRIALDVYRREFGEELETKVVHGGLECGCLMPKMPGLDAISIGPDAWGLHSPEERLSVSSAERVYWFIRELLKEMKDV